MASLAGGGLRGDLHRSCGSRCRPPRHGVPRRRGTHRRPQPDRRLYGPAFADAGAVLAIVALTGLVIAVQFRSDKCSRPRDGCGFGPPQRRVGDRVPARHRRPRRRRWRRCRARPGVPAQLSAPAVWTLGAAWFAVRPGCCRRPIAVATARLAARRAEAASRARWADPAASGRRACGALAPGRRKDYVEHDGPPGQPLAAISPIPIVQPVDRARRHARLAAPNRVPRNRGRGRPADAVSGASHPAAQVDVLAIQKCAGQIPRPPAPPPSEGDCGGADAAERRRARPEDARR